MSNIMRWDLNNVLGGTNAKAEIETCVDEWEKKLEIFKNEVSKNTHIKRQILLWQELLEKLDDLSHLATCLISENTQNQSAFNLESKTQAMRSSLQAQLECLENNLTKMDDENFNKILKDPEIIHISYAIVERRKQAFEKMPQALEVLQSQLATSGYHSWNTMYKTLVSKMRVPFSEKEG